MRGVGGRTLLTADQLEIKTLSPYNRGGVRAKEKGVHKANGGRSKLKRILGRGGVKEYMQGTKACPKNIQYGAYSLGPDTTM